MSLENPKDGQPAVRFHNTDAYRESYANSVQMRMSVWDFQLTFGTMRVESPEQMVMENFQSIYMSPQQAKALWHLLGQNLAQYEHTFGTLKLEPQGEKPAIPVAPYPGSGGPVN